MNTRQCIPGYLHLDCQQSDLDDDNCRGIKIVQSARAHLIHPTAPSAYLRFASAFSTNPQLLAHRLLL